MTHLGTKTLETPCLILRKYQLSDAEDMYHNWANSPAVTRFLSWEPHKDAEETRQVIIRFIEAYQKDDNYNWTLELKEIGQVVGSLAVVNLHERHGKCELGYCLSERFWGRGLMAEAVARVIDFLFTEVGLHRVAALHSTLNPASGKVMEKNGMKLEGTLQQDHLMKDGCFCDSNIRAILREDWEKAHQTK